MMPPAETKPCERLLVTGYAGDRGNVVADGLRSALPGVHVCACSEEQARLALGEGTGKGVWLWVPAASNPPIGYHSSLRPDQSLEFAREVLGHYRDLWCIAFTDGAVTLRPSDARLVLVHSQLEQLRFIADVLATARLGAALHAPTILEFLLCRVGGHCVLKWLGLGRCRGPLGSEVDGHVRAVARQHRTEADLGPLEELESQYRAAETAATNGQRSALLLQLARRLWDSLERSFLPELLARLQVAWKDAPAGEHQLWPLQIHLRCEPRMLAVPLDLAFGLNSTDQPMLRTVPVVYVLDPSPHGRPAPDQWNCLNGSACVVVYSCCDATQPRPPSAPLRGVPGIAEHAHAVAARVGGPAVHADNRLPLDQAFIAAGGAGQGVYVVSHGWRLGNADEHGVVIGPDGSGDAEVVTAASLVRDDQLGGAPFVFFNCCGLGSAAVGDAACGAYTNGFAHAVLQHGVASETICQRWLVAPGHAFKLAERFTDYGLTTGPGRAAALMLARRQFTADERLNPSWLAPVHAMVEPVR